MGERRPCRKAAGKKQWLQGLLYGRRAYTRPRAQQDRLFEQEGE